MTTPTTTSNAATFSGLVDLAVADVGGRVLGASDDFFAAAANLLQPGRATFIPGKFTERGKWMDGWESRRKRGPGYDTCVIALGLPGVPLGFDVDTQHFVGNHPPFVAVDGLWAPGATDAAASGEAGWHELLAQAPLRPDAQNLFVATSSGPITHVRLNIFPDGGVARFRVFGRVSPRWDEPPVLDHEARRHVPADLRDLAALANGGLALACSDAFFGPMNNLLLPGRPTDMGSGWETRRRRGPGHDWIVVKLGARGVPGLTELDTAHFKGNFPERCSLDGIDAPAGARITELLSGDGWRPLLGQTKLGADARHFLSLADIGPITHVRLNIFPDGGVARLRLWGRPDHA